MKIRQFVRHPFARYLFAVVLVALMAVLQIVMLHGRKASHPWLTFFPVVIVAAVVGGIPVGLLATGLASIWGLWSMSKTQYHFVTIADWSGVITFAVTGVMISIVCEAMRRSQDRVAVYRTLVASMDEGFSVIEMLYDTDGRPIDYRFIECNPAFEHETGFQNALGKTIRQLVPDHDSHWFEIYGRVAQTGEELRFQQPAVAMHRHYDVFAFRVGGEGSSRVGILFKDISEQKSNEQKLIIAALYDKLTGLPNRAMFRDYFGKALARADRDGYNLALLFFDLDGFKEINDTFGRPAGDTLLCLVSERLISSVRAGDLVSRFGGDEFAVILENCQPDWLPVIAERFLRKLELPIDLEGQAAQISASIGIVTYPNSGADEETLIRKADDAMYSVKKEGKGGYKILS